jgi:hypothetical protein
METTKEGNMICATVIGLSGKKYSFMGFDVSTYPDNEVISFKNSMTVYIFFKDINNEKPTLLDVGYRDGFFDVPFKDFRKFEFIKQNNVTHFIYYTVDVDEKPEKIRWDIIDGNTFDNSTFRKG